MISNSEIKDYKVTFSNPGNNLNYDSNIFGCSVNGFSNHSEIVGPDINSSKQWEHSLPGIVITGDFQTVLDSLQNFQFIPKVLIILFNNSNGIDLFIKQIAKMFPGIHIIGGGAAIANGNEKGELYPKSKSKSKSVSILAIEEGNYKLESLNLFIKTGIEVEVKQLSTNIFRKLRLLPDGPWQNAVTFFAEQQKARGIPENNFELMTFCDRNDRNIHCSIHANAFKSGSTLPEDNFLYLVTTTYFDAEEKLAKFISSENSLIFGCAGIRSLIRNPLLTGNNSLIGFMFGELFTLNSKFLFGNLMLTKLTIIA